MTIDNVEERLLAQQDEYDAAPAASNDSSELPEDGDYQALVRGFDFFESKAGVAYMKCLMEITLDANYEGREVAKLWQLEPRGNQSAEQWRKSLSFLKGDLRTLGIPADTPLSQIRPGTGALDVALDVPVAIAIRTSEKTDSDGNPYRNVYINERLGGPMSSPAGAADVPPDTDDFDVPPPEGDDDIPF